MKSRKELLEDYIREIEEHLKKCGRFQENPDGSKTDPFYQGYTDALNIAKSFLISEVQDQKEDAKKARDYMSGYDAGVKWFDHNIRFNLITIYDERL